MAPLIRREICWSLLCSPLGGGGGVTPNRQKDSDITRIGRVTTWMHANYQKSFKVGELTAMPNISTAFFIGI